MCWVQESWSKLKGSLGITTCISIRHDFICWIATIFHPYRTHISLKAYTGLSPNQRVLSLLHLPWVAKNGCQALVLIPTRWSWPPCQQPCFLSVWAAPTLLSGKLKSPICHTEQWKRAQLCGVSLQCRWPCLDMVLGWTSTLQSIFSFLFPSSNYFASLPIPYLKVLLLGGELLLKHLKADPKINCPLNYSWHTPP